MYVTIGMKIWGKKRAGEGYTRGFKLICNILHFKKKGEKEIKQIELSDCRALDNGKIAFHYIILCIFPFYETFHNENKK